ncbi:MAG: SurA N-terminal domain-containing protein [Desulfovibrionaceae bacterium]|nr:SurA N-terminal domain-containing protein [Desulfovibrionaceae bacterium]
MPVGQALAVDNVVNRILVKINNNIITQYDLDEKLRPVLAQLGDRRLSDSEKRQFEQFRKHALADMVNDILIQQEVEKYNINISDEDVDKEIELIKKERHLDDEGFEAAIAQDGLTVDVFRERMKQMMQKKEIVGHMVNKKVLVTDSEIENEYEARKDEYTLDKMVEVAILMLPPEVSAVEVRTRIKDGEMTFAEAVSKYSVGPAADSGGSLGEMKYADLAEEWKQALVGVPEGGVSEPLNTPGGEALLSPVKISENSLVPLEDVRDAIYQELMQKRHDEAFTEYFDGLKERAVIIYMDESLRLDNGE